jgi:UDP-N-acetylmuramoyl-L-alanyl-D-glutamate--2,6-diaminopimelate ligase
MEAYAKSKKELFDTLPENSFAVINQDDKWGEYMASDTRAKKYFFSLKDKKLKQSLEGLEISWNKTTIKSKLIGTFNAYNILGIYTTAKELGISEDKIITTIAKLDPPRGRLEFVKPQKGVNGIIDFAHTPDALENVLKTIREVMPNESKIITVVGCPGERDRTKRPIMGKIAYELSDYVVFSADNPQSEDPNEIIREMTVDLPVDNRFECESDRTQAIAKAFTHAKKGDVILMAGKGHENYQYMKDGKVPFSEKEQWEKVTK